MTPGSLRIRLIIAWAIFIAVALQGVGLSLRVLFERSITRQTEAELSADVEQIKANLEFKADGTLRLDDPSDAGKFATPGTGYYWQIWQAGEAALRSGSLRGGTLKFAARPPATDRIERIWLTGPHDESVLGFGASFVPDRPMGFSREIAPVSIVAGTDAGQIQADTAYFTNDILACLTALCIVLIVVAAVHVSLALRPLEALRADLSEVRRGGKRALDTAYPDELMPLVDETNRMLDAQHEALILARSRAEDLAHGLKTPVVGHCR